MLLLHRILHRMDMLNCGALLASQSHYLDKEAGLAGLLLNIHTDKGSQVLERVQGVIQTDPPNSQQYGIVDLDVTPRVIKSNIPCVQESQLTNKLCSFPASVCCASL